MLSKKLSIILPLVLFCVIAISFSIFIKDHLALYTYPFNPTFLEKLYGQSQYVMMEPISVLPDETIYAHAAWQYMKGVNPAVFNADQPPLGKYFIGLSELFFNNERISGPLFNVLSLVALFFLSRQVLKNVILSLVVVMLFSLEKIFTAQMLYAPLLDNIQLFFILLSFIFIIKSLNKLWFIVPAFLTLGLVMATKFWVTGAFIYVVWLIFTLLMKQTKRIGIFLITSPLMLVSLILVYAPSLLQGDSIKKILGVQHYIYEFHRGKINLDLLSVWDLLIFNRWHIPWEGTIKSAADWQWTWPVITILSVFAVIRIVISKKKESNLTSPIGLISIWFVIYFLLLFIGTVLPRYLFPILPVMYILSVWVVQYYFYNNRLKNN